MSADRRQAPADRAARVVHGAGRRAVPADAGRGRARRRPAGQRRWHARRSDARRHHHPAADAARRPRAAGSVSAGVERAARCCCRASCRSRRATRTWRCCRRSPVPEMLGPGDADIPPAVGEIERRLVLTSLVQRWSQAMRGRAAGARATDDDALAIAAGAGTTAQAAGLAAELARLMDEVETEAVSLAMLDGNFVPDALLRALAADARLPRDRAVELAAIPRRASSSCPTADRRNRLVLAEARRLERSPPAGRDRRRRDGQHPRDRRADARRGPLAARRAGPARSRPRSRRGELGRDHAPRSTTPAIPSIRSSASSACSTRSASRAATSRH